MNLEDSNTDDEMDMFPTKMAKELNFTPTCDNPLIPINTLEESTGNSGNSSYLNDEYFCFPGPAGDVANYYLNNSDNNSVPSKDIQESDPNGNLEQLSDESDNSDCDILIEENPPWLCPLSERTHSNGQLRNCQKEHTSIISERSTHEIYNDNLFNTSFIETRMIWSEEEAYSKQVSQIGPSSCGATAVINTLKALQLTVPSSEIIQTNVNTRLRANSAPLVKYLLSRSNAGCTHLDIIKGLFTASNGLVFSRFFHMFPERACNLNKWLSYWISKGAVPIATLNLQVCEGDIPDAWHHQMIYGIGDRGIYLTNPMECVPANLLWSQLCSKSVLLIKKDDVISRLNYDDDLYDFNALDDVRWKQLKVKEQVTEVIEELNGEVNENVSASHITIPAEYKSGITLAVKRNTLAFSLLQQCPELPWVPTGVKVSIED